MNNIINLTKMSFSNLTSNLKNILIVIIIWYLVAIVNPIFLNFIFGMGTWIFLNQVMACEDMHKIDNLIATLPVKRSEYIISRYILGIGLSILAITVSILIYYIGNTIDEIKIPLNVYIMIGLVTSTLSISTMIPTLVRFGTNKGKIISILVMLMVMVIPTGVIESTYGNKEFMMGITNMVSSIGLPTILTVSSIVVLAISMVISLKLYNTKELK